ncbi:MAG: winged helix-turn-helix transcriptional regulator [Clostridia bacterium]|jgi:hypothetical protein|nr:winged helix-turn-helix transcriptional regulator [Clostridia bacterium]
MKYDVCIVTKDKLYSQWILLELSSVGNSVCFSDSFSSAPSANLYIIDTDTANPSHKVGARAIFFGTSRRKSGEKGVYLERPFSKKELFDATQRANGDGDIKKERTADKKGVITYNGREIALTQKEYELYSLLAEAKGDCVTRELLSERLWGRYDGVSLNLYVHYLRQKLECDGKRAIRSHRGKGYSIILREGDD